MRIKEKIVNNIIITNSCEFSSLSLVWSLSFLYLNNIVAVWVQIKRKEKHREYLFIIIL